MNPHSALHPYGLQAHRVADLFWTYFDVAALVFVLVVGALVVALARRRRIDEPEKAEPSPDALRGKHRAIGVATGITVVTLIGLLVSSVATGRALASLSPKDGVPIKVVARKWWWEFQYPASVAGSQFTTAYELHVPVGKPIELSLESHDVIHSFWVPSLSGKRDAIPGKKTTLVLIADAPGTYEGQCAEFCGTQHANMRFRVVAQDEAEWRAWMKHQWSLPAPTPRAELRETVIVPSRYPLWIGKLGRVVGLGAREQLVTRIVDAEPDHKTKIMGPTLMPLFAAIATGGTVIACMFTPWGLPIGTAFIAAPLVAWFWPHDTKKEDLYEVQP